MISKLRYGLPLLVLLALTAGCASVSKPEGWATPELVDDTLYVSLDDGEMSAVNSETYEVRWTFPANDKFACGDGSEEEHDLRGIYGKPAIGGDRVFVGAYDTNVYALDKATGECQWTFNTDDWIVGGVVLAGDLLYVPSTDGNLYVLNADTGEEVQRVEVGDVWSSPTLTEDHVYVSTMDGELWKFGTDPLEPSWPKTFKVSTGLLTNPVVANEETVVVGGIGQKLFGVDAVTGEKKWTFEGNNWFWGEPAVDDTTVYATSLGGRVYAIDTNTGDVKWEFEAVNPIRAGAVVSGSTVVVVDDAGTVSLIDAETGELIADVALEKSVYATPYVSDAAVLILTRGGKVFSVDVETARATEVVD